MRSLLTLVFLVLALSGLSAQEARLVADINPNGDSDPTRFFNYNGQLLFRADDDSTGVELYLSDGTELGTIILGNLNADPETSRGNSNPDNFTLYDGKVYFKARGTDIGDELFVTDGTLPGTQLVTDINPGGTGSNPFDFIVYDGLLYFTARDAEASSELFRTDGTAEGTELVFDINEGGPGNPLEKTLYNDRIYFNANDGIVGSELWSSDGTAAGTMLSADVAEGDERSLPSRLIVHDGLLYFRAQTDSLGRELYRTNGTDFELVADLEPGEDGSSPDDFFVWSGILFFTADTEAEGRELYAINPATGQPVQLTNFVAGPGDADFDNFVVNSYAGFPDDVVFTGEIPGTGSLIILMNRNAQGQIAFSIYVQAQEGTTLDNLFYSGSTLYYTSDQDTLVGEELYRIGFFDAEPTRLTDIVEGPEDSNLDDFTVIDSLIFFSADGPQGNELYKIAADQQLYTFEDNGGNSYVSGDTIDFGRLPVGSGEATIVVDFNSTGNVANAIVQAATPSAPFGFDLDAPIADVVEPDESFSIPITFDPTVIGSFTDTISFEVGGPNGPEIVSFLLIGEAFGQGALEVTDVDGPLENFGDIVFGDVRERTDTTIEVFVENTGTGDVIVTAALLGGAPFSINVGVTELIELAPGDRDTIEVTFTPDGLGEASDSLIVVYNIVDLDEDVRLAYNVSANGIINSINNFGIEAVSAFPNPVVDRLTVQLAEAMTNGELRVYDGQGRLLRDGAWPDGALRHDVDLTALPTGIYSVEISQGGNRTVIEVVKR